jgi:hypothetical protein
VLLLKERMQHLVGSETWRDAPHERYPILALEAVRDRSVFWREPTAQELYPRIVQKEMEYPKQPNGPCYGRK